MCLVPAAIRVTHRMSRMGARLEVAHGVAWAGVAVRVEAHMAAGRLPDRHGLTGHHPERNAGELDELADHPVDRRGEGAPARHLDDREPQEVALDVASSRLTSRARHRDVQEVLIALLLILHCPRVPSGSEQPAGILPVADVARASETR